MLWESGSRGKDFVAGIGTGGFELYSNEVVEVFVRLGAHLLRNIEAELLAQHRRVDKVGGGGAV